MLTLWVYLLARSGYEKATARFVNELYKLPQTVSTRLLTAYAHARLNHFEKALPFLADPIQGQSLLAMNQEGLRTLLLLVCQLRLHRPVNLRNLDSPEGVASFDLLNQLVDYCHLKC